MCVVCDIMYRACAVHLYVWCGVVCVCVCVCMVATYSICNLMQDKKTSFLDVVSILKVRTHLEAMVGVQEGGFAYSYKEDFR